MGAADAPGKRFARQPAQVTSQWLVTNAADAANALNNKTFLIVFHAGVHALMLIHATWVGQCSCSTAV